MRRLLAVTALTAVLLAGAGCAAERPERTAPPGGAPVSGAPTSGATPDGPNGRAPGAGSGAAGGNAPEVCAAAQRAGETAVRTYVEELGRMVAAVGASDAPAARTARDRISTALTEWRSTLRRESTRAEDAQLKTLLADMAAEVGTLGTDVESIDETELDRLRQRLDQLCAR
ncbi:hypothetical protein OG777_18650 [Micromonospora peucetia]|uniref:Uncharacterized protein n=1 Tax=Micromonospora peucetia TaxID=47871 RepID=A0A1C6VJR0_9ACTN|nr:hypothetical protein [Micromonospora peucetia]MCX4388939.1 hypothetical protein [Micromonospora peucetia]WSA30449.1 hypothetical protein OIE14_19900 [Micromonospora peucetia]SCL66447.1 hypothetical protein GA0070608_3297 [Micromonospora peucetia]